MDGFYIPIILLCGVVLFYLVVIIDSHRKKTKRGIVMFVEHKWIIGFDETPQEEIENIIENAKKQGLQVYSTTTSVCISEEKYFDLRGGK